MKKYFIVIFILIVIFISACSNEKKIADKICARDNAKVQISRCGEFYSTYPEGFVQDASTAVYDAEGNFVYACGGFKAFINDQEREKEQKLCADYLKECKIIKSC